KSDVLALDLGSARVDTVATAIEQATLGPDGTLYTVDAKGRVVSVARRVRVAWPQPLPAVPQQLFGAADQRLAAADPPTLITAARRDDTAGPAGALAPGQADRWRLGMGGGSTREAAGGVGTVHVACGPPGDWAGRRADRTAGRRHCLLPARFTRGGGACEGRGVGRLAAHGVAAPRRLPRRVRRCRWRRRRARGSGDCRGHG